MFSTSWFFDLMIIMYACCVLFYFLDFLHPNRKVHRLAFWLLLLVWMGQTCYFFYLAYSYQTLPLYTRSDTLFLYAWLLISSSILIHFFLQMEFLLFFTNVIGFSLLSFSMFMAGREMLGGPMGEQFSSEWLMIHISMAFLSYAAFTLSFIFSILYLLQHKWLKMKKWRKEFRRWPSLVQLDTFSYFLNLIAVPLLLLSLILGIVWASHTLESWLWTDSKVIFSVFVLFMYTLYLFQRLIRKWTGIKIAELNVICFLVLLVNYFLSNLFSSFHLW